MKFHCEYCRELIDAEKDKKCPSCGATYENNKEYKKLHEEQQEFVQKQRDFIQKQQEFVHKQFSRIGMTGGIFAVIIAIAAAAIMGIVIYLGIKESKKNKNEFNDVFNTIENKANTKEEKEAKTVLVNQEKSSKDYKVTFEKYKLIEQSNDKEFDKLEVILVIEKISDEFAAWGEEIYCLVNNLSQNVDNFNSDTSTYIKDKNIPETKKMTYYVPKGLNSFDIKYGNKVSFHVDIEND